MQKMAALGCVGLVLLIGVIFLLMGVGGYNHLNTLSNDVDGRWADVQAQYQRRADLIPSLVSTVQGSANFEKSTLTDVIDARAKATSVTIDASHAPTDPAQLEKYNQAQGQLTSSLSRLLVSVEKYPDLKSTQGFRDLQAQLEGTENRIADYRGKFNTSTQAYNTARNAFPTVLYANLVGMKEKPFFKADEASQAAPKVDFGAFGTTPAPSVAH